MKLAFHRSSSTHTFTESHEQRILLVCGVPNIKRIDMEFFFSSLLLTLKQPYNHNINDYKAPLKE